ncbi:MAG: hypothetical protein BIFFINMI_00689 [Phycisphaerae bacterium]|nr:hypothetical protein [Phycisphaerae bacterium]
MKPARLILLLAGLLPGAACAQTTQPEPQTQPDSKVVTLLDRVEQRGQQMDGLTGDVKYVVDQGVIDKTTYTGTIKYMRVWEKDPKADPATPEQLKADPRAGQRVAKVLFRIQFDDKTTGDGYVSDKKEIYVFDGRWLHELKEKSKQLNHREIVPEGESLDPTRLGEGPFPLPFGQKKADVLENFRVELIAPAKDDPKESDHVKLMPKAGSTFDKRYKRIEFYLARDTTLPLRVVLEDFNDTVKTAEFSNLRANPKLTEKDFELRIPDREYEESSIPLSKGEPK